MKKIKFKIRSATDTGLVRAINEDCHGLAETPNGYLCVVCDGMGGHAGGAMASGLAVECIVQYLSKEAYRDARQALTGALDFANMQIIGTAAEHPDLEGMGTTACVLLLGDDEVWLAHAGDSRIYLFEARKRCLHRLTKDHSYVQGLVAQGIITEEEAETHPNKNRILKALGVSEELHPEVCRQPVLPARGDLFLVCSDGLSGMVTDKRIQQVLAEETTLQQKETALMSLARSAGGTDNITFQLIEVTDSPYKRSVFANPKPLAPAGARRTRSWKQYATIAVAVAIGGLIGGWLGGNWNAVCPSPGKEAMAEDSLQASRPDSARCDTLSSRDSSPNPVQFRDTSLKTPEDTASLSLEKQEINSNP
jgi:serine/threonine protein phosphatase PrpC